MARSLGWWLLQPSQSLSFQFRSAREPFWLRCIWSFDPVLHVWHELWQRGDFRKGRRWRKGRTAEVMGSEGDQINVYLDVQQKNSRRIMLTVTMLIQHFARRTITVNTKRRVCWRASGTCGWCRKTTMLGIGDFNRRRSRGWLLTLEFGNTAKSTPWWLAYWWVTNLLLSRSWQWCAWNFESRVACRRRRRRFWKRMKKDNVVLKRIYQWIELQRIPKSRIPLGLGWLCLDAVKLQRVEMESPIEVTRSS